MKAILKAGFAALFCSLLLAAHAQSPTPVYPEANWARGDPGALGWSTQKLSEIGQFLQTVPQGTTLIIDRGHVVAEWGDTSKRVKLSSVRKSLVSALYGTYVGEGRIDLSKTMEQLGVNDVPPLTPAERQASLVDVLKSRSGIYRAFVAGTPAMRADMPARGSHPPGTFWYYNNWDFNVAGAILEQQIQVSIGTAFRDRIAVPLQMQDFRAEDVYYVNAAPGTPAEATSMHPAYQFRMSARDLARVGYLFLRNGSWNGKTIVPGSWVRESTTSYSSARSGGYGYYWWVNAFSALREPNYNAQGALGKYLVVFPTKELVVVYVNHTDYPDDSTLVPEDELKKLRGLPPAQMQKLLQLVLEAKQL